MDYSDRQVFTGPPENVRDVVISSTRALGKGEWEKCNSQIMDLQFWNLLANPDPIKVSLTKKIKETGLQDRKSVV